jgi:DNA-binding IclR family transcriptional regulator
MAQAQEPRQDRLDNRAQDSGSVQSVVRAMDILTAFNQQHPRLQLHELADAVGLPRSSTRRLAHTLVTGGFLRQDEVGFYCLGGRLVELGTAVAHASLLAERTALASRKAHDITGETVLVAEVNWIERATLITSRLDSSHTLTVASPVGRRSPITSGCLGKAALAGLPPDEAATIIARTPLVQRTARSITEASVLAADVARARAIGYALESDEFIEGVSGVAVAIVFEFRPIGVLAVIAPSLRAGPQQLDAWGRMLVSLVSKHKEDSAL